MEKLPRAGTIACGLCQREAALYHIGFAIRDVTGYWYACPACTDLFKKKHPYALVVPLLTEEEVWPNTIGEEVRPKDRT